MSMRSWIRNVFARPAARPVRKTPRWIRPAVEALEDRLAPASLTVNTLADNTSADAVLTLREAVLLCNHNGNATAALGRALTTGEAAQVEFTSGGALRIGFASALSGPTSTIPLSSRLDLSATAIQIFGPGSSQLAVSGNGVAGSNGFFIGEFGGVVLSGLTIKNFAGTGITSRGFSPTVRDCTLSGNGVGIWVQAPSNLLVNNCVVSGNGTGIINSNFLTVNSATLSGNGTGISNNGRMAVNGSTLSNNTGRGISNYGELTVGGCTISGNSGGGIYTEGPLTVQNSTLSGNTGNAIHAMGGRPLTVQNSTLSGNTGNAIHAEGGPEGLTVQNCTFSGNSVNAVAKPTTVENSTFINGGISSRFNFVPLTVTNSTFTGGGISTDVNVVMTVQNSTFWNNSSIFVSQTTLTLRNSIVSHLGRNNNPATPSTVTGSYNLIGSGDTTGLTNTITGDPRLAPLGNYGGPSQTMALLPGSPAINAGNNALIPAGVTTDQRGPGFARVFGGTVDIGAFEAQLRTVTWTGAGADSNWTTSANWQGGGAPVPGDDLVFPAGAARPGNSNTFAAATAFRSLTLSGAGYTLGGNTLTLTNGLTAAAAGATTVALNLTLNAAQTLTAAAGAQLTLSGAVTGSVAVTKGGAGQLTVAGSLTVASFRVTAGTLNVAGPVRVTTFTNTGGTVTVGAAGYVDATGNYVQTAGRTTLNGGIISAALTDLQGGILDGAGSGFVLGDLRNAARIDVGGAGVVGALFVVGNYTQTAAGTLNLDLAGTTLLGNYDFFYVDGTASLSGTLNVNRLGSYLPNPDDLFVPLFSGGLSSGTFGTINGLTLSPTRALLPVYFDNGLVLYAYAT